ncbi:BAP31 protein, partial [Chunga burmeisteri]|nr:BAP31 protein [Chunga burmeisteri]
MSLQWTAVANFLYTEVVFVLLLCVPFVSAAKWQKIFKMCVVGLAMACGTVFVIIIIIPVLLLFGGCWDHPPGGPRGGMAGQGRPRSPAHPASHSLLCCLVTLILHQAVLGTSTKAFWKQAEDASQAACLEDNEALQKV